MKVEDLPAVELSGLCSAMSGEELVNAIILHSNWSWLTRVKRNREKLADFIMQSRWMDSRLLQLLSFSENPSNLDGEQLFLAAKYALARRSKTCRLCKAAFPLIRYLDTGWPPSGNIAFDNAGNANVHIDIDGEQRTVPLFNYFSTDYEVIPPPTTLPIAEQIRYIYELEVLRRHNMTEEEEEAAFVRDPLWLRLNLDKIQRSHLVEICFGYNTVKRHERFFWNVVESFVSLMTSSQVLSIRVIYNENPVGEEELEEEEKEEEEVNSLLRDIYARVVRPEITRFMTIPMKWTLHLTPTRYYAFFCKQRQWYSDLQY